VFLLYGVSQLSFRYLRIMKFTSTIQCPNRFIEKSTEIVCFFVSVHSSDYWETFAAIMCVSMAIATVQSRHNFTSLTG
jgi:hypothetical protein